MRPRAAPLQLSMLPLPAPLNPGQWVLQYSLDYKTQKSLLLGKKKGDASLLLVAAHCEAANCFDLCQFPPFLMLNRVAASHIRFGSGRGGCPLFYNEQSIPAPSLMPPNAFCYAVSMQTSAQVYSALLQVLGSEWI